MYIFIDESGTFQVCDGGHLLSCVAALIVPESFAGTLFRKFRRLTRTWTPAAAELKGNKLDENQIQAVIRLVGRFDVLVIGVGVDMGMHTEEGIRVHKAGQASHVRAAITSPMNTELATRLETLASRVERLPNQLYAQLVTLHQAMVTILQSGTLYYAERIPATLGALTWRLDAKDQKLTEGEAIWQDIGKPLLQTSSLLAPLLQLCGANYAAFAKFERTSDEPPPHLKPFVPQPSSPFQYLDLEEVFCDLKFAPSHRLTGLRIVDVLASAMRRACNGRLQRPGWVGLGRLMPRPVAGRNCVRILALQDLPSSSRQALYDEVILQWDRETKRMVLGSQRRRPGRPTHRQHQDGRRQR